MSRPRLPLRCGTQRAYRAHLSAGEPIDELCQVANYRGRTVTEADLVVPLPPKCRCSACCCDLGGVHCRQAGCAYCLTTAAIQEKTHV
ncbi:hypothetical protein ABZ249_25515 [Nocardiopsis sp. NPDC006139]|uniref:hypothetical protein n=1 Tax=Nocardiopsis sp. NPDC006139 TaxID=3154578 RepID=UPI0033B7E05C